MSLRPPSAAGVVAQIRDLLGLGGKGPAAARPAEALGKLERMTRERLLEWAGRLGLTDLQKLTKSALAGRIQAALRTVGVVGGDEPPPLSARKFDLGGDEVEPSPLEDIPWSYGQDRVTAMVVDPDRLYVYWEATDEAIARARAGLGAGGADAWLNLRVYDVTGRLFDGTNAHSYGDQRVERTDRQWFFHVGRPSSTACVELGLKSFEGYFVRIARSGRADFPRREPARAGEVAWLTVRAAMGESWPTAGPPSPPAGAESPETFSLPERLVDVGETRIGPDGEWIERRFEWSASWQDEASQSSWEAGPFPWAVDAPLRTVEEWHSTRTTVRTEDGRTHVVYGPWQVVIRGLAGHAARRIVAVWEMRRSWIARGGTERLGRSPLAPGASERVGASERRWLAGSEARLRGASELYLLGASERRLRGASERWLGGASESRARGASEERLRGASERRLGGASERR